MTLYYCFPYQKFQVFDYIKEKWYKRGKYIPRENKEIRFYDNDKDFFIYANSLGEAKEKYFNIFNKEKIKSSFSYYHYDYGENYKIFQDKLELKTFLHAEPYQNSVTLPYLKEHMNSEDYLLYCKHFLLDTNIKDII